SADWQNKVFDSAPDSGMFNFSLDDGGPKIESIALTTIPAAGPKAGKKFVVTPTGLTLPPSGSVSTPATPESYTCQATLNGRALKGSGIGGGTVKNAEKKTKGKARKGTTTGQHEGATQAVPPTLTT